MSLTVDHAHLGTSESRWQASRRLEAIEPLEIPACRRLVMVAPHPDDEVLGAGGLAQVVAGRGIDVVVVAVTDVFNVTMWQAW